MKESRSRKNNLFSDVWRMGYKNMDVLSTNPELLGLEQVSIQNLNLHEIVIRIQ